MNRTLPQSRPYFKSMGSAHFLRDAESPSRFQPIRVAVTERKITASRHRMHWKVKGPIRSIPTLWAIKAVPQIMVQSSKLEKPNTLFFIFNHHGRMYHIKWEKARKLRKKKGIILIIRSENGKFQENAWNIWKSKKYFKIMLDKFTSL